MPLTDAENLLAHIREQTQTIADLRGQLANEAVVADILRRSNESMARDQTQQIADLKATVEALNAMLRERETTVSEAREVFQTIIEQSPRRHDADCGFHSRKWLKEHS